MYWLTTHTDLRYCPARFFWDEPMNLREPDVKAIPANKWIGALDWFCFSISKRHLDMYGSYPIYSGYEQSCDFTNAENGDYCDGGFLKDKQRVLQGWTKPGYWCVAPSAATNGLPGRVPLLKYRYRTGTNNPICGTRYKCWPLTVQVWIITLRKKSDCGEKHYYRNCRTKRGSNPTGGIQRTTG